MVGCVQLRWDLLVLLEWLLVIPHIYLLIPFHLGHQSVAQHLLQGPAPMIVSSPFTLPLAVILL